MAVQEIVLSHVTINPDTLEVEVGHVFDGQPGAERFSSVEALLAASQRLIVTHEQANLQVRYYALALGGGIDGLIASVGKKLVLDVRPAVAQTIALVDAQP